MNDNGEEKVSIFQSFSSIGQGLTGAQVRNKLDFRYPWCIQIFKYASKWLNIIDLISILPYYLSFFINAGSSLSILRILRLARILRIFRLKNLKKFLLLITTTISSSFSALALLLFFATLLMVIFASVEYFLERGKFTVNADYPSGAFLRPNIRGDGEEESPFDSILMSCYWAAITTTTVGYGDIVPTTFWGRVWAALLMFVGILIIALPVGVLGSAFNQKYEQYIPKDENTELMNDAQWNDMLDHEGDDSESDESDDEITISEVDSDSDPENDSNWGNEQHFLRDGGVAEEEGKSTIPKSLKRYHDKDAPRPDLPSSMSTIRVMRKSTRLEVKTAIRHLSEMNEKTAQTLANLEKQLYLDKLARRRAKLLLKTNIQLGASSPVMLGESTGSCESNRNRDTDRNAKVIDRTPPVVKVLE